MTQSYFWVTHGTVGKPNKLLFTSLGLGGMGLPPVPYVDGIDICLYHPRVILPSPLLSMKDLSHRSSNSRKLNIPEEEMESSAYLFLNLQKA